MKNNILILLLAGFSIFSSPACSRKTVSTAPASKTADVSVAKKSNAAPVKIPTPKVINVNDLAAQKTLDGRFYYDLNGKRYWKNNKDGKYYLFNKGMYNNPDFKGSTQQ